MDDRLELTLIRHGITEANIAKQYLGWRDEPLYMGEKEKIRPQSLLKADLIISSDLRRCKETAEMMFPFHEIQVMKAFREFHFGDWDGKTYEALKHDPVYQAWLNDFRLPVPNGESLEIFQKRIWSGLQQLLETIEIEKASNVVVVTHGGVIRQLLTWLAPDEREFWKWDVPFRGGWTLYTTRKRLRGQHRCISLQAVSAKENENGSKSIID